MNKKKRKKNKVGGLSFKVVMIPIIVVLTILHITIMILDVEINKKSIYESEYKNYTINRRHPN